MRCSVVAAVVLVLAGCIAIPPPRPLRSPLTFDSPAPTPEPAHRVYLPLLQVAPNPKRGVSLACGYDDMARQAAEVDGLRVAWVWNWEPNPPLFAGIESVPCVWDASDIGQSLGGNSEWLLGFNEPDDADQANMTPEQAAREWRRVEQTYPERKLTSPQVMVPGTWLEDWYAAYQAQNGGRTPRIDALAVHTYYGNDITAYQTQVLHYIDLANKWGVEEVWVTEFALSPGLDRTLRETLTDTAAYVAWLDAQPLVTRYAPWTNRVECMTTVVPDGIFDTPLYAANGALTPLGAVYRDGVGNEETQ